MMTSETEEDLKKILTNFMKTKAIENFNIIIDSESDNGADYTGEIISLKVITESEAESYDLVIKIAKSSTSFREVYPIEISYSNEILIYNEIFPFIRKFLIENQSIWDFDIVPKYYFSQRIPLKEALIFENVKHHGYKHHDNRIPWNMDHVLLSMKNYGMFHAISLAIKDKKPEIFNEWKEQLHNFDEAMLELFDMKAFYREPAKNVLRILAQNKSENLAAKFNNFYEEIITYAIQETAQEDEIVLIHGDCWNNNFLFKYEGSSTKPSKMCFLDFQRSRIDSPVKDLAFNLYTTCDKSSLDNFDELLRTYYNSLRSTLELLNCDPGKLLTFEQLVDHWRKYGKYGLFHAAIAIKLLLLNPSQAPDLTELAEGGQTFEDNFESLEYDKKEYDRRITDIFSHFAETFM